MDCARLHELLDAHLAGRLSPGEVADLEAHLADCEECAGVVATLAREQVSPLDDASVVRPVLAATTGRTCATVQEVLAGEPDRDDEERAWAEEHTRQCVRCAAVARVLGELPVILPTFASEDPGPDFTAEVLLETLERPSLWKVFVTRVTDHFRSWQRRPAFAQELSYALTVALVLITVVPGSPLSDVPRQALSVIQVTSGGADVETEAALEGTVGAQLRLEVRARSERLGVGFDRLGTHVIGTGRGLVDGDLDAVGENAGQIGCDLRRLWTGVREPAVDPESVCG
jgi:predicted anti-sigma-YlaC factor YlaD